MLRFPGVAAERAERLRALAEVGWAVTIERAMDEGLEVCVIEGTAAASPAAGRTRTRRPRTPSHR